MKNFGTLYRYELKKLLKRKLSWAIMLLLCVACVFATVRASTGGGIVYQDVLDEDGNPVVITGEELREQRRNAAGSKLNGRVMDDAFFQEMLESVPDFVRRGARSEEEVYKINQYFRTVDGTWSHPYSMVEGLLRDTGTVTAEIFYAAWQEQTQSYLDHYAGDSLTEGEKDYWRAQIDQIERPFIYRYCWPGTTPLIDFFYTLLGLLPIAAAVCVCSIFSEDRRTRMDALVFSARESRFPLYLAKVLAGAAMSVLVGVVIVGMTVAAHLAVWGWKGLDASLQMWQICVPRPITVGEMLVPMLLLLVLYTLAYGGVAMLASALTRSAMVGLVAPVLLVQAIDRFHPLPYGWKGYLPDNLMGWSGPTNMQLVSVFGVYLDNFQFGMLLYLGIAAVLLALCWLGWRRSAVGKA